jgi:hypothetical protein
MAKCVPGIVFEFENSQALSAKLRTIPADTINMPIGDSPIGNCVQVTFKALIGLDLPIKLRPVLTEITPVIQRAGFQLLKAKTKNVQECFGKGFSKVFCLTFEHCFGIDLSTKKVLDGDKVLELAECPAFKIAYFVEKRNK